MSSGKVVAPDNLTDAGKAADKRRVTGTAFDKSGKDGRALDVHPRNTEGEPLFTTEVPPTGGAINHQNGTVATAGTPITITPPSGNIKSIIVQNPFKGPNENGANNVLLISIDGGTTYYSVAKGGQFNANPVDLASFGIDTNIDGTNYELILEFA